jgi:hypothetical protein
MRAKTMTLSFFSSAASCAFAREREVKEQVDANRKASNDFVRGRPRRKTDFIGASLP